MQDIEANVRVMLANRFYKTIAYRGFRQWGHNFRPDYLRLADFAKAAKASARLALTATATPKVGLCCRRGR